MWVSIHSVQYCSLHSSQTATVERFWQHNTHTSASSSASSCVPQPSKQLLNACPIPPVHVIVTLLAGCQSAILSSNEWHNDMNPAIISTIMAPNFEIKEITSATRRSIPIANHNICRCPGGQGANPYNVAPTYQRQQSTGGARVTKDARHANVPPQAMVYRIKKKTQITKVLVNACDFNTGGTARLAFAQARK